MDDNPSPGRIQSLSSKTNLSGKQIYKWFWERRKRAHGELDRGGTEVGRGSPKIEDEEEKVYD